MIFFFTIPIFLILLIFVLFLNDNLPQLIGKIGEHRVSRILAKLNENDYRIFNDIYIKLGDGKFSQIDHIVVSIFGIFVIETKNYSGWIFGAEQSEYWTRINYKNKKKFRNPIKQNYSHIYALKEVLTDFNNIRYFPIVVFSGSGDLKNIESKVPVVYSRNLLDTIVNESITQCVTQDEVSKITAILNSRNIQDKEVKKEHAKNIKNNILEKQLKQDNLICPKCDGTLLLRNGKYGKFYGCSNYPRCKFTIKY